MSLSPTAFLRMKLLVCAAALEFVRLQCPLVAMCEIALTSIKFGLRNDKKQSVSFKTRCDSKQSLLASVFYWIYAINLQYSAKVLGRFEKNVAK